MPTMRPTFLDESARGMHIREERSVSFGIWVRPLISGKIAKLFLLKWLHLLLFVTVNVSFLGKFKPFLFQQKKSNFLLERCSY